MNISDFLAEPLVVAQLPAADKETALAALVGHVCAALPTLALNPGEVADAVLAREKLGSTAVGEGVAIPHAKIAGLKDLVAGFARCEHGVEFGAIDAQPVRLIFLLLVPEYSAGLHLKALARISRLLRDSAFRAHLLAMQDRAALYTALAQQEQRLG